MASTQEPGPLSADERAELEALRADARKAQTSKRTGLRNALRWTASGVLMLLVAVLAMTSVLARYVDSELLDTDRYVETVTPLGADPAVQNEIADQVTRQIYDRLDIESLTADALAALSENAPRVPSRIVGLAPALASQAESYIRETVGSLVSSDEFESLWIDANRVAHQGLVAVVTGETDGRAVQVDDKGTVSIPLEAIVSKARERLSERGFTLADKIPTIDAEFVLFQSPDLVRVQKAVNVLDKAATWLPWFALFAAVGAVFAAPKGRRLRSLSLVGLAVAISMALLALSLNIARKVYGGDIPPDVLSPAAASAIVDTLAWPLQTTARAVFVVGLVVALIGYLAGGSRSASVVRRGFTRGVDAVRKPGEGRAARPIEIWAAKLLVPLRVSIVAVAVTVLLFWRYPTGMVVLAVAAVAVFALIVLEVVARAGVAARESADA